MSRWSSHPALNGKCTACTSNSYPFSKGWEGESSAAVENQQLNIMLKSKYKLQVEIFNGPKVLLSALLSQNIFFLLLNGVLLPLLFDKIKSQSKNRTDSMAPQTINT